jgi:hypothetical protein
MPENRVKRHIKTNEESSGLSHRRKNKKSHDLVSLGDILADSFVKEHTDLKRLESVVNDIQSEEEVGLLGKDKGNLHLNQEESENPLEASPTAHRDDPSEPAPAAIIPQEEHQPPEPLLETPQDASSEDEGQTAMTCLVELFVIILSVFIVFAGMASFYIILTVGYSQASPHAVSTSRTLFTEIESTSTSSSSTVSSTTSSTTSSSASSSTIHAIVCSMPYIRFGLGCCLDMNTNSICDSDETTTSTTTIADYVFCSKDSECGATRVEYICRESSVYRLTFTHFCRSAGTKASNCERNVLDELVDICKSDQQCVSGRDQCQANWAPNNFVDRG